MGRAGVADAVGMPARVPKPPKPCIERLPSGVGCPEYALPGKSRCERTSARRRRSATCPPARRRSGGVRGRSRWSAPATAANAAARPTPSRTPRGKAGCTSTTSTVAASAPRSTTRRCSRFAARPATGSPLRKKTRPTLDEYKAQIRSEPGHADPRRGEPLKRLTPIQEEGGVDGEVKIRRARSPDDREPQQRKENG
jgi:hypothetical protein